MLVILLSLWPYKITARQDHCRSHSGGTLHIFSLSVKRQIQNCVVRTILINNPVSTIQGILTHTMNRPFALRSRYFSNQTFQLRIKCQLPLLPNPSYTVNTDLLLRSSHVETCNVHQASISNASVHLRSHNAAKEGELQAE